MEHEAEFRLTDDQAKEVLPLLERAERDYDEKHMRGVVLFQITRDLRGGPVSARGIYLPQQYSERVIAIVKKHRDRRYRKKTLTNQ